MEFLPHGRIGKRDSYLAIDAPGVFEFRPFEPVCRWISERIGLLRRIAGIGRGTGLCIPARIVSQRLVGILFEQALIPPIGIVVEKLQGIDAKHG